MLCELIGWLLPGPVRQSWQLSTRSLSSCSLSCPLNHPPTPTRTATLTAPEHSSSTAYLVAIHSGH
ncbi:hypothetical protein BAUCODRAFT_125472 [Baudoinia panamericana UAMH 10762]|uniref:Uncharacterized protein n=1 Tax=Baudoinia panamericana (strain UAMH 10762) TaxID=717646 RepID=M2MQ86_BAUPA|nr:uncharacterized protein BAUCODRAFT_125472 [Baudoinia panamericana UAMH 10762]EMC93633.1 hypothetical protein BAUCODRAFT_125472 [Baudoinia panamericana UAMH 10762]